MSRYTLWPITRKQMLWQVREQVERFAATHLRFTEVEEQVAVHVRMGVRLEDAYQLACQQRGLIP